MSFFSRLFKGGHTADTVADTLKESAKSTFTILDEAFHTEQEKSEANAKAVDAYIEIYKTTMKESTGTAEARRWFLQCITNYVLLACTICIAADVTGYVTVADSIVKHVTAFQIGWAFVAAVGFYFLTHVAKNISGK